MDSAAEAILSRVLEPLAGCFTPEVAQQVVNLRADANLQARLDELAVRNSEGELSDEEREEYEAYVEAIDVISILQTEARRILAESAAS